MAIKFFKASPFYLNYIEGFYGSHLGLKESSYQEQYSTVMADCFGLADFWKINLEKTGDFICMEVISNNQYMQKKWAQENNIKYTEEHWNLVILEQQLIAFQPDVFFAHDYWTISPSFIKQVRKKVPRMKLVLGWDGIWKNDLNLYSQHDIILSCIEDCADFYTTNKKIGYFFPVSFEKSINSRLEKKTTASSDTSFIGSVIMGKDYHIQRFKILSSISKKIPVNLWLSGYFSDDKWKPYSFEQLGRIRKNNLHDWYNIWQMGRNNKGELFGLKMYQTLASSKINLNIHIDAAKNKAANMRLLEVTGVGSCLVTDWKENLKDYFDLDKEIVTFRTPQEAVDKIKWLLQNEEELKAIATAGQERTLKNYSLEARIARFSIFLQSFL